MTIQKETRHLDVSSDIVVRPAKMTDLQTLVNFNAALARETEGKHLDLSRLAKGVQSVFDSPEHGFYLVAEEPLARHVVGQVLITYEWSDWRNGVFWWLQSVFVELGWRRRGVFRALYDYVIEEAKGRKNVAGVRLYVEKENRLAQQVYQELGLRPAGYQVYELDFVLSSPS